jgi:hypothetical protein
MRIRVPRGIPFYLSAVLVVAITAFIGQAVVRHENDRSESNSARLELLGAPASEVGDEALLTWAEAVLAGRCMVQHGHQFVVNAPTARDVMLDEQLTEYYGTVDVKVAAKRGYGINPRLRPAQHGSADPNLPYLNSLDSAGNRAFTLDYFGDEESPVRAKDPAGGVVEYGRTGCLADARSELYGGIAAWAPLDVWALSVHKRAYGAVTSSAAYRANLAKWRSCMAAKKAPADSPADSRERIAKLGGDATAEQAELKAAVAEASCNKDSGITASADKAHRVEYNRIIAADATEYKEFNRRRNEALAKARKLLAESYG